MRSHGAQEQADEGGLEEIQNKVFEEILNLKEKLTERLRVSCSKRLELRKLAVELEKAEPEEQKNLGALEVVLDQRVASGDQIFEGDAGPQGMPKVERRKRGRRWCGRCPLLFARNFPERPTEPEQQRYLL